MKMPRKQSTTRNKLTNVRGKMSVCILRQMDAIASILSMLPMKAKIKHPPQINNVDIHFLL